MKVDAHDLRTNETDDRGRIYLGTEYANKRVTVAVVIVRLDPAEGHEMKKNRPAVVVQNDVGNRNASTTIVAPATGTYRGYPFEVLVEADNSPFEKDSPVRLDQIRAVSIETRIHSVAGSLNSEMMIEVDEVLELSLSLD